MIRKGRGQSLRLLRSLRVVSKQDAITVTWLAVAAMLQFVYLRFGEKNIDPFIITSVVIKTNTFVWMLCSGLGSICIGVFAYRAARPRLKIFALLWTVYCIYDVLLFIWCYNEKNYYYLPYFIMLFVTWKIFRQ
jgi:hypothetical protein